MQEKIILTYSGFDSELEEVVTNYFENKGYELQGTLMDLKQDIRTLEFKNKNLAIEEDNDVSGIPDNFN